ncbi:hypothetical protein VB620_16150 [Nodularia harveyana UHCC-0300]|uniref:Uncharacterized protein n=1 Tax=Nodularia harveyana UHCC-0300 TaxID=2974287 RepID=A0ABU5UHN5_9CYAN|nr:hypothetical protein [Nodularia harveyana]MEA5582868.1 hypothetical protein [Nodularia harveyana UHCC-0300]
MKSNQISAQRQPQESLWRELTAEESEKVQGGFGFLLFNRNNIRGLLSGFLSQISARVRDIGVQNMITPGNGNISVERTQTTIIENGVTVFTERTENIITQ